MPAKVKTEEKDAFQKFMNGIVEDISYFVNTLGPGRQPDPVLTPLLKSFGIGATPEELRNTPPDTAGMLMPLGMAKMYFGTGGGRAKMLEHKAQTAINIIDKGINPSTPGMRVALTRDPKIASRFGPFIFQVEDSLLNEVPQKMGQTIESRLGELGVQGRLQQGYGDPIETVSRVPREAIESMALDQKIVDKLKGGRATPQERIEIDKIIVDILNKAHKGGLR